MRRGGEKRYEAPHNRYKVRFPIRAIVEKRVDGGALCHVHFKSEKIVMENGRKVKKWKWDKGTQKGVYVQDLPKGISVGGQWLGWATHEGTHYYATESGKKKPARKLKVCPAPQ